MNQWTEEELPTVESRPYKNFSIGEELSTSFAARLQWSSSGLAKNHRCGLAVLTTNLVLSIWTSKSDPRSTESWERRFIVNLALDGFYRNKDQTPKKLLCGRRVRAFTWGPSKEGFADDSPENTGHVLAVANDLHDIFLIQIQSPYNSPLCYSCGWSAHILHYFESISTESNRTYQTFFESYRLHQEYVSEFSWSSWTVGEGGHLQSALVLSQKPSLKYLVIQSGHGERSELVLSVIKSGNVPRSAGNDGSYLPRWLPCSKADPNPQLLVFTNAEVIVYHYRLLSADFEEVARQALDENWDLISGKGYSQEQC